MESEVNVMLEHGALGARLMFASVALRHISTHRS